MYYDEEKPSLLESLGGAGKGALMHLLWLAGRPSSAVMGGAMEAAKGDLLGVPGGALGGLLGETSYTAGDVMNKLGIPRGEKWGTLPLFGPVYSRDFIGGLLNVGSDPLMYTKIGQLSNVGHKTLTSGGDLAPTIARQFEKGERSLLQFGSPLNGGGKEIFGQAGNKLAAKSISEGIAPGFGKAMEALPGGKLLSNLMPGVTSPLRNVRDNKMLNSFLGEPLSRDLHSLQTKLLGKETALKTEAVPVLLHAKRSIDALSQSTGRSTTELNSMLTKLVEAPTPDKLGYYGQDFITQLGQRLEKKAASISSPAIRGEYRALKDAHLKSLGKRIEDAGEFALPSQVGQDLLDNVMYSGKGGNAAELLNKHIAGYTDNIMGKTVPENLRLSLQPLADDLRELNSQVLFKEQAMGVRIDNLQSFLSYSKHMATDELKAVFKKLHPSKSARWENNDFLAEAIPRHLNLRGKTVGEANEVLRDFYGLKGNALVISPIVATSSRVGNHARVVSQREMMAEILNTWGRRGKLGAPMVDDELKHLGEFWTRSENPSLRGLWHEMKDVQGTAKVSPGPGRLKSELLQGTYDDIVLPEKVVKFIDAMEELQTPAAAEGFLGFVKKFNSIWVPYVLAAPSFFTRNMIDDTIRAHLGGLRLGHAATNEAYKESANIITLAASETGGVLPVGSAKRLAKSREALEAGRVGGWREKIPGLGISREGMYKEALSNGVIGKGFFDTELYRAGDELLSSTAPEVLQKQGIIERSGSRALAEFNPEKGKLFRANKRVNTAREDWTRLAMYIKLRRDGLNAKEAASKVNAYLYDYSVRGGKGEKIARTLFPFFSFSKANYPFWASYAVGNPGSISLIGRLTGTGDIGDKEFVPDIVREGLPVKVSESPNGKVSYLYGMGISLEELNRIVPDSLTRTIEKVVLANLSPIIKYPAEKVAGKNFYFGTDIDSYRKAGEFLKAAPEPIQRWLGFKEIKRRDGSSEFTMSPDALQLIQNSPAARAYAFLAKSSDSDRTWLSKVLELGIGAKGKTFNPEEERQRAIKRGLKQYIKEQGGGGVVKWMERPFFPKEAQEHATPELRQAVKAYLGSR